MVLKEFLSLSDLSGALTICIYKLTEVCENKNLFCRFVSSGAKFGML